MLGIDITVTIIYTITLMSVFLNNKNNINSEEHEVLEEEDDPSSPVLKYYEENIPGAKPNALYKNTKFMTLDKINGGLLTESEKKQITEVPTGYNFNLKGSGYLIVDVDVDGYFSRISIDDIDDVIKLLNPALKDFEDKIRITEYQFNNKRKKIDSRNFANIFFSSLFMTPYVLTPSKGFHYYFINDLTDEQLTEVFGHSDAKYIKCIGGFTDVIDIDIFVDNKKDDSYIVLPLSNVVIENKRYAVDQENNFKLINVSYSGLRYTEVDGKLCDFRKASTILDWLKKYAKKSEHHTVKQYATKYSDRGRVVSVSPMNKVKYVKYMSKDFDVLSLKCSGISTFASKPFNLYQLMAFIAFFPIDMHLEYVLVVYIGEVCVVQHRF